ncbi:MAG: phosphatidate cytidylyltransferase, partial [Candidatus Dormibacteria bacterium]
LWPSSLDHFGLRLVGVVLLSVVAGDTAALFAGSAFGRHPFFASISPHKTVEGAVAAALATMLVVLLAGPPLVGIGAAAAAGLGVLIAVAAQGGDLAESALKRQAGEKDSSHLIPGHGGLLDRVDSLVLVAPVAYCYLRLIAF